MSEEKLLTVRDVAVELGVSEKDVLNLAENGSIPAYKIGGVYVRFKREQVEDYKKKANLTSHRELSLKQYSSLDRVRDFFYFNDFYILTFIIIFLLLFAIFYG